MQIRQILATAAVAAVTAPVALLSVSPAYAGTQSAVQTQEKPSIAKLKKAVKEAKKAYRAAVAAKDALVQQLKDAELPSNPLKAAADSAKTAADKAAADKATADKAVTDAQVKLDAATTEDEKAAAQTELDAAKTAAGTAATAKTDADAKLAAAEKAYNDLRVEITKQINKADQDIEAARVAKEAAKKALADALAEEPGEPGEPSEPDDPECAVDGSALKAALSGLPSKIAAGSTVDFRLRLTNSTKRTLPTVLPYVAVMAFDKTGEKDISSKLHLKTKQGGTWKTVDQESYAAEFTNVKPGAHADLPLRLTVDRSAPAGRGVSFAIGEYHNEDENCGTSDLAYYEFTINPVGAGNSTTPADKGNKPKPQGSASPVATSGSGNGSGTTDGSLASTGSSSALPTIGLAGGAAVVLGAGAVFVVRRRKADANS
ncbi:LPXTG cell wall anchor domain-containing protein [Streptomyces sp. NPDC102381]|uniref:LPXTG cell wall anchor domain-containing protein n=1 Tax=Streptomyces sp. NPDC102381 TaxID=3366164 RepID=UPI0038298D64